LEASLFYPLEEPLNSEANDCKNHNIKNKIIFNPYLIEPQLLRIQKETNYDPSLGYLVAK
jgi:hypothetical protein